MAIRQGYYVCYCVHGESCEVCTNYYRDRERESGEQMTMRFTPHMKFEQSKQEANLYADYEDFDLFNEPYDIPDDWSGSNYTPADTPKHEPD
jgi:hypothetical protein